MATKPPGPRTRKTATSPKKPPQSGPRPAPWERQPAESDQSWAAFVVYRDLAEHRSLVKVAERVGKSRPLMERWSQRHSWVLRVGQYDSHTDRVTRNAITRTRLRLEEKNLTIASAMLGVAASGLSKVAQSDLKTGDIARLAEAAARLESAALALSGVAGGPMNRGGSGGSAGSGRDEPHKVDFGALPDEDRRARMIQLQRELDSRLRDDGAGHDRWGDDEDDDE